MSPMPNQDPTRKSWALRGGLDLVTPALTRYRYPGAVIACMNYEAREEGYRRVDGYERFDGHKSPSDILTDTPGTELKEAEKRRAAIGKVPGQGDILGVWRYRATTYAFRKDTADVTRMYRSSPTGWQEVNLGWRVEFSSGSGAAPEAGEALSGSSIGARVLGVYRRTGTWADGTAAGTIIVSFTGSSQWGNGATVTVEATGTRTFSVAQVPSKQAIPDGNEFAFWNENFFGQAQQEKMYGLTGGGLAFEFDGSAYFPLDWTGPGGVWPKLILAHQKHLFVGYENGSVVHSAIGNPKSGDATEGAVEIALGDKLTGLVTGYRDALFMYGRNLTKYVLGQHAKNWQVKTLSGEAGAMRHSTVLMDEPVCLDDRGIRSVSSTDKYGDFDLAVLSKQIRPLLDHKREGGISPIAAIRVKRKSQYRLYFSDGEVLLCSLIQRGNYAAKEYMRATLDLFTGPRRLFRWGIVRSICSVEDPDGRERIFFSLKGSDYVYEGDKGWSFDGKPIEAFIRCPYNDHGAPGLLKQYQMASIDVDSNFRSYFKMKADFDDERYLGRIPKEDFEILGPTGLWDEFTFGSFYWDAQPKRYIRDRIPGRGRNVSITMFSRETKVVAPHTLTGVTVYFWPLRMVV